MVTPFNEEGQLDEQLTKDLVNHLIETGTDSLIVNGTTGESPTVSDDDKITLLRWVKEAVDGRVPIIAGTGSNCTASSIELTKRAEEVGVDGVMLVTPYYNKPDQRSLYAHFSAIAASTTLPILLYNIPGRSVINMTAETTIKLSKIDNIRGIKEASGNLDQMSAIIEGTADDFSVYSGDDGLTLPLLSIGGKGVISVASHLVGREMQQMIAAFERGEHERAAKMHRVLLPAIHTLFSAPNPIVVKHMLNREGVVVGGTRLPLAPLEEDANVRETEWEKFRQNASKLFE